MEELITIVIPVYNVKKYLNRCLESVVGQTYCNLEIILIDDGSKDSSGEICDAWSRKDDRIHVIHKENAGLGMARNTGIENATGKYICFFDSDDYIHPETVAHSVALAREKNAQIVFFGMYAVNRQGDVIREAIPRLEKDCYCDREVLEELLPCILSPDMKSLKNPNIMASACSGMFSMELIKQRSWRFVSEKDIISEDIYSLLDLFRSVNSVAVLKEALYYYCENESSLTRTYHPDRLVRNKVFYQKCIDLCVANNYPPIVLKSCMGPFLGNIIGALKQVVEKNDSILSILHEVRIIVDDPTVQEIVRAKMNDSMKNRVRMLLLLIKERRYFMCFLLLKIKTLIK